MPQSRTRRTAASKAPTDAAEAADRKADSPAELVIPLSKPIVAHDEALTELVLGDPEIGCLDGVRLQLTYYAEHDDRKGTVHFDLGDLYKVIAGLAHIPPSAAKTIRFRDALKCRKQIMDFFQGCL